MDTVKFSLRLFLTHMVLTLVTFAFMPVLVSIKNVIIQWMIAGIFIGLFWLAVWADSAMRGEKDSFWSESEEKRRQKRGSVDSENIDRSLGYFPSKGFIAGLIASIPGMILSLTAILAYGNVKIYTVINVIIRIWLSPYIHLFGQFPKTLPYLFLILVLIFPIFSGLGYLHGPARRQKIKDAINKSKVKQRR